jgi:hypothetical protein
MYEMHLEFCEKEVSSHPTHTQEMSQTIGSRVGFATLKKAMEPPSIAPVPPGFRVLHARSRSIWRFRHVSKGRFLAHLSLFRPGRFGGLRANELAHGLYDQQRGGFGQFVFGQNDGVRTFVENESTGSLFAVSMTVPWPA